MFARRADTTLIDRRAIVSVRQFIGHLDTAAGIVRPVQHLLLGGHANSEGQMFIPMYRGQDGPTSFETLEETLVTAARSIEIPDALLGRNAGDPIVNFVHFKGCNIGKAEPFLVKFKEAFGDNVNVTAPKHFHGLTHERIGVFEWMAYEFVIRRRDAFANRTAAIAEFQGAGFALIDGSAVPDAEWANWIPRNIGRTSQVRLRTSLGAGIGRFETTGTLRQFRRDRYPYTFTITYPNAQAVPRSQADRLQELEDALRDSDPFAAGHPHPQHERLGYASFDDFFAGYAWNCAKNGRRLVCTGRRNEYTVVVPITDPATGDLIFNFYPNAGSPHAAITDGLQEDDADYFETV